MSAKLLGLQCQHKKNNTQTQAHQVRMKSWRKEEISLGQTYPRRPIVIAKRDKGGEGVRGGGRDRLLIVTQ